MAEIETIQQASDAAAQELREVVTLRGGEAVAVFEMETKDFLPLWREVQGVIYSGFEAYNAYGRSAEVRERTAMVFTPGGMKVEQKSGGQVRREETGAMSAEVTAAVTEAARAEMEAAETNRSQWSEKAMEKLEQVPDLLVKICAACTDRTVEQWSRTKFSQMLKVARVAIRLNFTENEDVRGFFGDVGLSLPGTGQPKSDPPSDAGTAESTES